MTQKVVCEFYEKYGTPNDNEKQIYHFVGKKVYSIGFLESRENEFVFRKTSHKFNPEFQARYFDKKNRPVYYFDIDLLEPISDIQNEYLNPSSRSWYFTHEKKVIEQTIAGATAKSKTEIQWIWLIAGAGVGYVICTILQAWHI